MAHLAHLHFEFPVFALKRQRHPTPVELAGNVEPDDNFQGLAGARIRRADIRPAGKISCYLIYCDGE